MEHRDKVTEKPTFALIDDVEDEKPTFALIDDVEYEKPTFALIDDVEDEKPTFALIDDVEDEQSVEKDINAGKSHKKMEQIIDSPRRIKTPKALKNETKLSKLIENVDPECEGKMVDDYLIEPTDAIQINIRISQRNGRKSITTIEDIPQKIFANSVKVDNYVKKLASLLATRSTIKTNTQGNKYIEYSGSNVQKVIKWICEFVGCDESNIKVHGQV
jgi:translation initiation factor 1 (eIF-1/SUI1)